MSLLPVRLRHEIGSDLRGLVVAGTGHRPNKLLGYSPSASSTLRRFARAWLQTLEPARVISGMALGWDQALAEAAVDLALPLVAAIPFAGQESRWPEPSQLAYRMLLEQASSVVVACDGPYSPRSMQVRNEWMSDHSDLLVALHDGSAGGTCNCVRYAESAGRPILNLWSSWQVFIAALPAS